MSYFLDLVSLDWYRIKLQRRVGAHRRLAMSRRHVYTQPHTHAASSLSFHSLEVCRGHHLLLGTPLMDPQIMKSSSDVGVVVFFSWGVFSWELFFHMPWPSSRPSPSWRANTFPMVSSASSGLSTSRSSLLRCQEEYVKVIPLEVYSWPIQIMIPIEISWLEKVLYD
jgi:hypothetical protein